MVGSKPLREQAKSMAQQVRSAFGVDACVIRLLEGEDLVVMASAGIPRKHLYPRLPCGFGLAEEIISRRQALFVPKVPPARGMVPVVDRLSPYHFTSYAGTPLIAAGRVIGILGIYWVKAIRQVSDSDMGCLQIVGNSIAAAIVNDRLFDERRRQEDRLQSALAESKRAETALRESEEKFRVVTENARAVFGIVQDDKFVYANPYLAEISGYTVEEIRSMDFSELVHPAFRDMLKERAKHRLEGGKVSNHYEFVMLTKSGEERWMDFSPSSITYQGKPAIIGTAFDITDLKRTQEVVKASEVKYRRMHENMMDAFVSVDMAGRITDFNEVFRCMLGYEREELLALSYADVTPAKWHKLEAMLIETQVRPRGFSDIYEKEYRRKNGVVFPVELRSVLMTDNSGTPIGMWAMIRDITERKRAGEALQQSEERFRSIVESSPMAMYFYQLSPDESLILTGANPAADRTIGVSHQCLLGKTIEQAFPPLAGTEVPNMYRRVAKGEIGPQSFEIPYRDERFTGFYDVHVFRTGPGIIAVAFTDIQERKQAEEKLRERDEAHLDQMRRLARDMERRLEQERASVSRHLHDGVGQSLTSLMMRLAWVEKRIRTIDPVLGEELKHAGQHAGEMIDDIRKVATSLRPVAIEHDGLISAIRSYMTEFQRLSGIKCRVIVQPRDLVVKEPLATTVYRIIQEAMTNVARHAQASRCDIGLQVSRDQLELTIRDDGKGTGPAALLGHASLGILGMQERASAVGGDLQVQNGPKGGVLVRARFPLPGANAAAAC